MESPLKRCKSREGLDCIGYDARDVEQEEGGEYYSIEESSDSLIE